MKIVAAILLFAPFLHGQTLSPLHAEFGKKARGEFTLQNNGFKTLAVTLDAVTLQLRDGRLQPVPLESTTHVKLSEYSARVPAKQVHTFGYSATCDVLPCAFIIFSSAITGHTDSGIAIATHFGTTAYICPKQKGCRQSFLDQVTPTTVRDSDVPSQQPLKSLAEQQIASRK